MSDTALQNNPAGVHKNRPKGIPIETLLDLRFNKKLGPTEIAKLLGISRNTVQVRLRDYPIDNHKAFKQNKADILSIIQSKIINSITDSDIKKASLLQKTTAISQLIDKERLISGESTENISIKAINMEIKQIDEELEKLYKSKNTDVKNSSD